MRVCIVCFDFNKDNLRLQPWRYFHEVARHMQAQGHAITLITDGPSLTPGNSEVGGLRVRSLKLRSFPFGVNKALLALLDEEKPDVVAWPVGASSFYYLRTLKRISRPLVGIFPGPVYALSDIKGLGLRGIVSNFGLSGGFVVEALTPPFLLRRVLKLCRKVIVMSQMNKQRLAGYGVPLHKVTVIPPGVDDSDLDIGEDSNVRELRTQAGLDPDSFVVTYIGPPLNIRGFDTVVDAVSIAAKQAPSLRTVLLARPPAGATHRDGTWIQELCAQKGITDRVKLVTTLQDSENIRKWITLSDAVMMPFKVILADVPIAPLEVMAQGKTLISTRVDGIPELLREGRGYAIRPNDPRALSDTIVALCSQPELARDAGLKARQFMLNYPHWDEAARRAAEVLESARAGKGPSLVCVIGVDGAGKTAHVQRIRERFKERGIASRYTWLRFHHFMSLGLLAYCRLAGLTRFYERDGEKISYHEFHRSRVVSFIYPWLLFFDMLPVYFARVLLPMRSNRVVVCDRFVYDTLVDLMVDTGDHEIHRKLVGRMFLKLVPKGARVVILDLEESIIRQRRRDLVVDDTLKLRRGLYRKLSEDLHLPALDNSGAFDEVSSKIFQHLGIDAGS